MNLATAHPEFSKPLHPPGGLMIWVFIFMELLAFGLAFIVFSVLRAKSLPVFEQSQAELNQGLALLNTLVLVTSGYFVVLANGHYDSGRNRHAARWLGAAIGLGGVFVIVKAVEYRDKIAHGLTTGVNQFFDFMEMKHAHRAWQVAMTLFMLVIFGAISVSVEQWRERWVGALQHSGIPIGLINGSVDPVSGVHMVERYREVVSRNHFIVELPTIGHYPQVEAPTEVLEAYLRFLRQL